MRSDLRKKAMSAVQPYESGEGLEEISFNRSDSIVVQMSAENEKISFNLYSSSLTGIEVEKDFGKHSIRRRKSRYRTDFYRSEI